MLETDNTCVPKKESDKWYHRKCWYNIRKLVLARDPVCRMCNRNPSVIVDHVLPHKGSWSLFLDLKNLQGLCKEDHDKKTAKEDGGFGRVPFIGIRSEVAAPQPTGSKGGAEFQSSSISTSKLDKALEMDEDFLKGL